MPKRPLTTQYIVGIVADQLSKMAAKIIGSNAIYKLIYLVLKIQEIFPSGLANLVNKLVHAHSFRYMICNTLGKCFLYFQPKVDYVMTTRV